MQILKTIEQISTKSQSAHLSEQHFPMYHTDICMYICMWQNSVGAMCTEKTCIKTCMVISLHIG